MTAHRTALRAAVVAAMAAALLTGTVTPVHAQPSPQLRLSSIGNIELRVGGGAQNVQLRVENRSNQDDAVAENVTLTMTVPLTNLGVHIASQPANCTRSNNDTRLDCTIPSIPPGGEWNGVVQVAVHGNSSLQSGETRNEGAQVTLTSHNGGSQSFNVRLHGPERPPAVQEVAGFVTDENTGDRISGATVRLVDSQGADFVRTTDGNGEFRFSGEDIAPGSLAMRASMDGFEGRESIQTAQAGQQLGNIQLTMRSTASPSPTPDATPSATPTATGSASPVAAPVEQEKRGMSFFTKLMIFLGILFVLLGVGAIALMIYRRRKEEAEEDGDDGFAGADGPTSGPGPRPTPGSHGVYRPSPTQVAPRSGAGPLTQVNPQTAAMADAPTMLHPRSGATNPAVNPAAETTLLPRATDPLGPRPPAPGSPPPPRPAAPTYGSNTATAAHASGPPDGDYDRTAYRGEPYGGASTRPDSGAGYGADRPTARYDRTAPAPTAYDSGSYGPDPYTQPAAGGYGRPGYDQAGYDQSSYGRGGYDQTTSYGQSDQRGGAGYDPAGYPAGYDREGAGNRDPGYGATGARAGGYDQPGSPSAGYPPAGYDQSGYDQPSAGQPAGYDRAGYDRGGHGQAGYGQAGYEHPGYASSGYGPGGYPPGYDQPGHGQPGYEQPARDPGGYRAPGYGQPGYEGQAGYGQSGYGSTRYDPAGYPEDPAGPPPRSAPPPERRRSDWHTD